MNHLFNQLLPLPPNVTLVIGTQKVQNDKLPRRLMVHSIDEDWWELPSMSITSIRSWLDAQEEGGRLLLPGKSNQREYLLNDLAKAFHEISSGHPLHLVYSFEALVFRKEDMASHNVKQLPRCPDGDIRSYYSALWQTLSVRAKELMYLFVVSEFNWPTNGMLECLGGEVTYLESWEEIRHLVASRRIGFIPFHGSVQVFIREQQGYSEAALRLLPKVIRWLETVAPEYWRWAFLWLTRARAGDNRDLISKPSRNWAIESLCRGRPVEQMNNILSGSERAALESSLYPRVVELRSLKTRILNGVDYQIDKFTNFQTAATDIADEMIGIDMLIDNLQNISDDEIGLVARQAHKYEPDVVEICMKELNRRLKYKHEFGDRRYHYEDRTEETLLQIAAIAAHRDPGRLIQFVDRYKWKSAQLLQVHLDELVRTNQLERLFSLLSVHDLSPTLAIRISVACIRLAAMQGVSIEQRPDALQALGHPLGRCWQLVAEHKSATQVSLPIHTFDYSAHQYYEIDDNLIMFIHYCFFATLAASMDCKGPFEVIPVFGEDKHPELVEQMQWLDSQAKRLAAAWRCGRAFSISALADQLDILKKPKYGADYNERRLHRLFLSSLYIIALDLHILTAAGASIAKITASDVKRLQECQMWDWEAWCSYVLERGLQIFSEKAVLLLIEQRREELDFNISLFNERAADYILLARLAIVYGLSEEAITYLEKAANCILGYGWRKDTYVVKLFNAIEYCAERRVGDVKGWLTRLAPSIEAITKYTDGDETDYARIKFIELVGRFAPEFLARLYERQNQAEEWRYAEATLEQVATVANLESSEARALVRTFVEAQPIQALMDRAEQGDEQAKELVQNQSRFLGRLPESRDKINNSTDVDNKNIEASELIDPKKYPPEKLSSFIDQVSKFQGKFQFLQESLKNWLEYWKEQGKAHEVIKAMECHFSEPNRTLGIDKLLDDIFELSLQIQGRDAAYPWAVRAHIYLLGWNQYYYGEEKSIRRLTRVAETYSDRWQQYIKDTTDYPWPEYPENLVIGIELWVLFLFLVGQSNMAIEITEAMVRNHLAEVSEQPLEESIW